MVDKFGNCKLKHVFISKDLDLSNKIKDDYFAKSSEEHELTFNLKYFASVMSHEYSQ